MTRDGMTDQRCPTTEPQPTDDRDIPCLNCGYNLRGLSGDPRRCPECGVLNPIGDVAVPERLIGKQLKRLETLPAVCAGTCIAAVVGFPIAQSSVPCCVSLLICPLLWLVCMLGFRGECQAKPGWAKALALYHLYVLILGGLLLGLAICVSILVPLIGERLRAGWELAPVLSAMGILAMGAVAWVLIRRVHDRMTRLIDPLLRNRARALARRDSRRDLQQHLRQQDQRRRRREAGF